MKILICCTTPDELKTVKEVIKNLNLKISLPLTYLCTGIGNHETIFQLTKFLTEHSNEKFFIIHIGICEYTLNAKEAIQASIVEHLAIKKEVIIPIFLQVAPLKKVISSETLLNNENIPPQRNNEEILLDRESRWIELVAQHFQLPRIILKVPVNKIGETQPLDRTKTLQQLKNLINYHDIIKKTVEYLHKMESTVHN